MFVIAPRIDTETCWRMPANRWLARVVADDLAGYLKGSQSNTILAISQTIMLGELAVNRALENIDPHG